MSRSFAQIVSDHLSGAKIEIPETEVLWLYRGCEPTNVRSIIETDDSG